jgi:hypothetical protein
MVTCTASCSKLFYGCVQASKLWFEKLTSIVRREGEQSYLGMQIVFEPGQATIDMTYYIKKLPDYVGNAVQEYIMPGKKEFLRMQLHSKRMIGSFITQL